MTDSTLHQSNRITSDSAKPEAEYALALVKIEKYDFRRDVIHATPVREPEKSMTIPFSALLRFAKGYPPGTPVTVNKGSHSEYTGDLWFATDSFAFVVEHGPQPDDRPPLRWSMVHPDDLTFDNPTQEKSRWLFAPGCEPTRPAVARPESLFYLFSSKRGRSRRQ